MDPLEAFQEEKKFLHDVANQLLVAQGMGSFIDNVIKENFDGESKEVQRSEKVVKAIDKIIELVKARSENLQQDSND